MTVINAIRSLMWFICSLYICYLVGHISKSHDFWSFINAAFALISFLLNLFRFDEFIDS